VKKAVIEIRPKR